MKRLLTSLLLMIVARLLMLTFGTFCFIYTHIKFTARSIRLGSSKYLVNKLKYYYFEIAWADDQKGNVLCQDVFNDWFVKRNSEVRYNYGALDHTVSHVTGKNKELGNLTFWGRLLAGILDAIDPGHTEIAATKDQFNENG